MIDKQAKDLDYCTPPRVLDPVRAYFGGSIPLDPATNQTNPTKAKIFYTPAEDGLAQQWEKPVYVNPPYGKLIKPWLHKIAEEAARGTTILALLPVVRTEQQYFQDLMAAANAVCWIRKRVSFIRPSTGEVAKSNPHASALWGFNVDVAKFKTIFSAIGLVTTWPSQSELLVQDRDQNLTSEEKGRSESDASPAAVEPAGESQLLSQAPQPLQVEDISTFEVVTGHCLELLKRLPEESIQCVVTSPPYYGLRDYGIDPVIWDGNPRCDHVWSDATCQYCGAWKGCLGNELDPRRYIAHMVEVFEGVRRVLAKDGVAWLNLGDSFCNCSPVRKKGSDGFGKAWDSSQAKTRGGMRRYPKFGQHGLKMKDLYMIPHRVAIALQEAGWYVRMDAIWHKPNPMPESVRNRPTKAHEYVFLLTKSAKYYYDHEAVLEPLATPPHAPGNQKKRFDKAWGNPKGKNRRSVWTISTKGYKGAHFAVMPEALAEVCVLAGSRPGDLVFDPFCGAGTTGVVSARHGRRFLGLEAGPDYAKMARVRISKTASAKGLAPLSNLAQGASSSSSDDSGCPALSQATTVAEDTSDVAGEMVETGDAKSQIGLPTNSVSGTSAGPKDVVSTDRIEKIDHENENSGSNFRPQPRVSQGTPDKLADIEIAQPSEGADTAEVALPAAGEMENEKSSTGPTGPTGLTGPTGSTGPTGPTGPSPRTISPAELKRMMKKGWRRV
jgi:DNA modification methylase